MAAMHHSATLLNGVLHTIRSLIPACCVSGSRSCTSDAKLVQETVSTFGWCLHHPSALVWDTNSFGGDLSKRSQRTQENQHDKGIWSGWTRVPLLSAPHTVKILPQTFQADGSYSPLQASSAAVPMFGCLWLPRPNNPFAAWSEARYWGSSTFDIHGSTGRGCCDTTPCALYSLITKQFLYSWKKHFHQLHFYPVMFPTARPRSGDRLWCKFGT